MNFGLILKSEFDRQKHLFSRLYKTLNLSPEKKEAHQQEIIRLAKEQIKLFGGNSLDSKDQKKAINRVLKLINLGLEYASKREYCGENGEIVNSEIAKAVLLNKPLTQIYYLGNEVSKMSRDEALEVLRKSEIYIGDMYFRLISAEESIRLKSLADIDFCDGTLSERLTAFETMKIVQNKLILAPFLPIDETGLMIFNSFGSSQKNIYPSHKGLLDILLLSMIIASMFRSEDEWFDTIDTKDSKDFFKTFIKENRTREELKWAAQAIIGLGRVAEEDKRTRWNSSSAQKSFLCDMITVREGEVAQFSEMLFFEPTNFGKSVVRIERFFRGYFNVAQETLHIKAPKNFDAYIDSALRSTEKNISQEVAEFFKTVESPDISREEVRKFWHQRVCFEPKKKGSETEGIALRSRDNIDPRHLAQMPVEYLATAIKYFSCWPKEKKKIFIDNLNPNRFINEDLGNSDNLIKFLKYISSGMIGGGAIYQEEAAICKKEDSWVEIVINKINWTNVNPSVISELWGKGDDEIRNALFKHREKFRVTLPALKNYYLSDYSDQRLFEYLLDKIAKEDGIKKFAWDSLAYSSQNLKAENIVKLKMREWEMREWEKQQKKIIEKK